jgi:hypothetical protein
VEPQTGLHDVGLYGVKITKGGLSIFKYLFHPKFGIKSGVFAVHYVEHG